jgi:hypothetical protein
MKTDVERAREAGVPIVAVKSRKRRGWPESLWFAPVGTRLDGKHELYARGLTLCPSCQTPIPITSKHNRRSYCKDCENARKRERRAADPEAGREYWRAYYAANREERCRRDAESRLRDPDQYAARLALRTAVARGALVRQPCWVCGDPKSQGHHASYAEDARLDVTWLCPRHHAAAHRAHREAA